MGAQKTWAWIIGVILVLVGIWGFLSEPILGIFATNTWHNLVHLITGLVFIWAGAKNMAKPTNTWLGLIYVLVGILGFFGILTFLAVAGGNDPDNWLHIGIGVISLLVGLTAKS